MTSALGRSKLKKEKPKAASTIAGYGGITKMKKWTKLFAVLALAVMLLLTACDDGTTGGGSGGTSGGNWGNGGGNTTGGGTDNTTTVKRMTKLLLPVQCS